MFPNVPLYPVSVMQRGGNVPVACRKVRTVHAIMTFNVLVCLLIGLLWNLGPDKPGRHVVQIPSGRFWRPQVLSTAFWNKEQQRLDFIHNPLFLSDGQLPGWLNDTRPRDPCEPDHRVLKQISDYNSLPGRFQDFLLHMRCRTYHMLINQPRVCDEKPFLLLAVKSLVPHFDRRQAIRETWGRRGVFANRTVVTVFLLGHAMSVDHFPDLLEMLVHEADLYKDLLQWDYRDTFFNLTLKEVLFLEWFSQNCPHAKFILKGDDDVFVNTYRIIEHLEGVSETKARDFFIGDVISNAGPHRDRKLKYFIPESVFVGQYPPYAGGGGYLYSGHLALRLYNVCRQVALYPIDDVYTGMCLMKLGLVPEKHDGFRTFDIDEKYRSNTCVYRRLMLVHSRTLREILRIWSWIVHPELVCQ
ncbi:N-acetyllactosaminide beta-1,3-N-acetylglucosaminyltransferase 2-like [Solea senegalensis]|uniref:Hexosyltransferase n=1 Tax=Solea senegalensis TaxID=28829 RepID=A0AAV6QD90_SOLSE|nr:N-acetyllactosaminide beta-1,3-N-acetylglucosaminyltransferase 2-like [Solea senegalensis]KAG7486859.1 N-acetyllactosaminide beta-1,3-N-acetylglucosaminyltransferase 2-like [Solea senegalensis]